MENLPARTIVTRSLLDFAHSFLPSKRGNPMYKVYRDLLEHYKVKGNQCLVNYYSKQLGRV